ncbi:hypothetical protein QWJ26_35115 [Streptomyces sp. CSDS2]|uniref:hypothetical protein n=1 Tax=Streptomyces sp. CSDS2 TaxID=3055051 RepID=UPI0025B13928|nr:hypothetical protein [Streptomyces sp. CSDS2]MDN3264945.1 hypothetical protein [Streptomyces sp. CSDS2]
MFTHHRSRSWRLLGTSVGLSAVLLWALAQAPAARPADAVSPRLVATVDGEGLRALFRSENRVIRPRERMVALTFNAAWNDAAGQRPR